MWVALQTSVSQDDILLIEKSVRESLNLSLS